MRKMRGTYCLEIAVSADSEIMIGALGKIHVREGKYVYVGSALKSLEKRLERHFRREKKKHWHIDYLLKSGSAKIERALVNSSGTRLECDTAQKIALSGTPVRGFGCSDCRCESHLYRIEKMPELAGFGEFK